MKREPVETMSRMSLMQECSRARRDLRRLRRALRSIDEQCRDGILVCPRCGEEDTMDNLDIRLDIREALKGERA